MDKPQNRFISVVYQLYTITDGQKNLEEQTSEERPFELITGFGIALDRFEEEVIKHEKSATFDFTLQPAEAFGVYDPEGVHKLGREVFTINGHFDHDNIFEGAVITLMGADDQRFMAKVQKIEEDGVTIDTNHPLAGKVLNFTGTVVENREATQEEVQALIKQMTGGCGCGCGHHHGDGFDCGHELCEECDCGGDHHHGDGCGCGHEHGEECDCGGGHHHDDGCGCGHCH